jgi:putative transposase
MKKSKFTETQIVFALKQAETGTAVAEVCRKLGISEATFYSWKKEYGGLDPAELRRLRQLEEGNAQLENITTAYLAWRFDGRPSPIAYGATVLTATKSALLILSLILIVIGALISASRMYRSRG